MFLNDSRSLCWPSASWRLYHVTSSGNLLGWTPRATWLATEAGTLSVEFPPGADGDRFFRVELAP